MTKHRRKNNIKLNLKSGVRVLMHSRTKNRLRIF